MFVPSADGKHDLADHDATYRRAALGNRRLAPGFTTAVCDLPWAIFLPQEARHMDAMTFSRH